MMAKSLESTPAVQMDNVGVSEAKPDNPYVIHSGDEIFCWRLNDARRRTAYPAISSKKLQHQIRQSCQTKYRFGLSKPI